ncbi:MAG TPA: DoxX family protein [Polyangia bacterium]
MKPELAILAALGCVALQVSAIVFHLSRREAANTPVQLPTRRARAFRVSAARIPSGGVERERPCCATWRMRKRGRSEWQSGARAG